MSSITRPSRPASAFVAVAPNAKPLARDRPGGHRQITLASSFNVLHRLDELAAAAEGPGGAGW
ncbi:MAG: hypothetical protein JO212_13955 [Acetobacteraceae bacterium]|nr:hypothetical protein [Acetobacteraceae bacterium]